MPIFDFSCRGCGNRFELLVRKNTPACPSCASEDLEKLISLPAIKSETTHALAMKAAKRRDARQGADRIREQREYELAHDD
jgi:putative FmdB family regulatory protein